MLEILAFGPGWGDELFQGLLVTLHIALLGFASGTVLALFMALLAGSGGRRVAALVDCYCLTLRSVPELLVIFLLYYGLDILLGRIFDPFGLPSVSLNALQTGTLAIALIHAAYATEVFRGAIAAVPPGLTEAARSLGLRTHQVTLTVVLPVTLRLAFPGLANLWVAVLKMTPLVSAIGIEDFIRSASTAGQNTKDYLLFYTIILVVYLVLSAVTVGVQRAVEGRLFRYMRREGS